MRVSGAWAALGAATMALVAPGSAAKAVWRAPFVSLKTRTGTYQGPYSAESWYVTPIHAALLPSGKVLASGWARAHLTNCEKKKLWGISFLLDPASPELTKPSGAEGEVKVVFVDPLDSAPQVANAEWADTTTFGGHTQLPDGSVFYFGGVRLNLPTSKWTRGLDYAHFYDSAGGFSRDDHACPFGEAWYPTAVLLPGDGTRVLVAQGWEACCRQGARSAAMAVFDLSRHKAGGDPWDLLLSKQQSSPDALVGAKDYIRLHVLPRAVEVNGRERSVAVLGSSGRFALLSTDPATPAAERLTTRHEITRPTGKRGAAMSTSALLATGEILVAGASGAADMYEPASGSWRTVHLGHSRNFATAVLLPNGCVLLVNGESGTNQNSGEVAGARGDSRHPLLFDPFTGAVEEWDGEPSDGTDAKGTFRGYHNVALLLADGRVLVGGGRHKEGGIGCENDNARVLTPPYYLGDAAGPSFAVRNKKKKPTTRAIKLRIGSRDVASLRFKSNRPLLASSGAVGDRSGAALMALGAMTHAYDQSQRYVNLAFAHKGRKKLVIRAPASPLAIPGFYNLFLVDDLLVPSADSVLVQLLPPSGK